VVVFNVMWQLTLGGADMVAVNVAVVGSMVGSTRWGEVVAWGGGHNDMAGGSWAVTWWMWFVGGDVVDVVHEHGR
jgi:hypothetical protein